MLGIPITLAARIKDWPKLKAENLITPMKFLLLYMFCYAIKSGYNAYLEEKTNEEIKNEHPVGETPESSLKRWYICSEIHKTGYISGAKAALFLTLYILAKRAYLNYQNKI